MSMGVPRINVTYDEAICVKTGTLYIRSKATVVAMTKPIEIEIRVISRVVGRASSNFKNAIPIKPRSSLMVFSLLFQTLRQSFELEQCRV
jgi:hypothetical protein